MMGRGGGISPKIAVTFAPDVMEELRSDAKQMGIPIAALIRQIVDNWRNS
jgi:hypothetical protein